MITRRLALLGAAALLPAACGRKGPIETPKGQEDRYIYPRTYPNPGTVVPGAQEAIPAPGPADIEGPTDEGFEDVDEELSIDNP